MIRPKAVVTIILLFHLLLYALAANAEEKSERQEVVDQAVAVLERFSTDESMEYFRKLVKEAKALFIIPKMFKGGLFLGGSTGNGVFLAQDEETGAWSYPAFYSMGSISVGFQAGAETSQLVFLIMTQKGMDSMLSASFKLGFDATAAAGPYGGGTKRATADILAYSLSKGIYGGLSLEGAQIEPKLDWNARYYGRPASSNDIIVKKSVSNQAAETLRQKVEEITQ